MHDFSSACAQFEQVFVEAIDDVVRPPEPRWFVAAQLVAAATDALGGAGLAPTAETNRTTFKHFVATRFPSDYQPYTEHLYHILRCGLLHAARTDKHGRNVADPNLGNVILTHRDIKPVLDPSSKRLTISVPHLVKAFRAAFDSFKAAPSSDEHTNFPLRFRIDVGATGEPGVLSVDSLGNASALTAAASGTII